MNNLLVRFVACVVLAVTWIIAWQEILYAGTLPGEGFTASVLMLLTVILQYVVLGYTTASQRIPPRIFRGGLVAGLALLLALLALPMLAGKPMFTAFKVPLGFDTLSSTTLFDVAIFLVVSGGMLAAFTNLREPRT
jgi:Domain related to MnhB subunit of Na+/H+ antiporter.